MRGQEGRELGSGGERGDGGKESWRREESTNKKTEKQSKLYPGSCISSVTYVQLRVAFEDQTHRSAEGRAKLCREREPGLQREVSG